MSKLSWLRVAAGLAIVLSAGCSRSTELLSKATQFSARTVNGAEQAFPQGFLWGVASAGYQYEGGDTASNWAAWEKAGHGEHRINKAVDHWNRYEEDLNLAKSLGLNAFRLSIEWARIEPKKGQIDQAAVQHYHEVLSAIRERGMEPIVTVMHFAYPAWLDSDKSAWESDAMIPAFANYAGWVAKEYGSQIKYWLTINEPNTTGLCGYVAGVHPPGKHNLLLLGQVMERQAKAHEAGYAAIHANDSDALVSVNPFVFHRRQTDPQYRGAMDVFDESFLDRLARKSNKKTLDYLALDYYYGWRIGDIYKCPTWWKWPIYPEGMYEVSKKYYERYHLPILFAENGFSTEGNNARRDGWNREAFLVNHIAQMRKAIAEGIPIIGYMHWSLVDNYEWGTYTPRFGLFSVEQTDQTLTRVRTPGANVYESIVKSNGISQELLQRYLGKKN